MVVRVDSESSSIAGKNREKRTVEFLAGLQVAAVANDVWMFLVRHPCRNEDCYHRTSGNIRHVWPGIVECKTVVECATPGFQFDSDGPDTTE